MALLKTVGVVILIFVAFWIIAAIVGFLAFAVWTIIKIVVIAVVVGLIYHHFTHNARKKDHRVP